jgi:hypothetical protein
MVVVLRLPWRRAWSPALPTETQVDPVDRSASRSCSRDHPSILHNDKLEMFDLFCARLMLFRFFRSSTCCAMKNAFNASISRASRFGEPVRITSAVWHERSPPSCYKTRMYTEEPLSSPIWQVRASRFSLGVANRCPPTASKAAHGLNKPRML